MKILDIGCGTGNSLDLYSDKNLTVTAVDINPEIIKYNRHKYPHVNFQLADCLNLPFKNSSFSKVYLLHVLEHLKKPQKALNEAERVLIKGGLITIAVPHSVFEKILKIIYPGYFQKNLHRRIFQEDDLLKLINENKLQVLSLQKRRFLYGLILIFKFILVRIFFIKIDKKSANIFSSAIAAPLFRFFRQVSDIVDKLPALSFGNRILPYEIFIIAHKK